MTPTDDSELDEVLNDLISIVPTRFENKMDLVRIKEEAKAAINRYVANKQKEAVEKVIGEDEPETELKEFNNPPFGKAKVGTVLGKNVARNELRAEQRAKLKTLSSEGKDG